MYISLSLLERGLAEAQVEEIVRVSVLRNRSLGVTGALLLQATGLPNISRAMARPLKRSGRA